MRNAKMTPPFPYFGGKRHAALFVWEALGDPALYVEPFCGGAAVLLGRPSKPKLEVINDIDGFVCNFWRAARSSPAKLTRLLDRHIHEIDLHALHRWLCDADRKAAFIQEMRSDHEFYDVEIAAYWCWGMCMWWGSGFCGGEYHGNWSPHTRGAGLVRSKRTDRTTSGVCALRRDRKLAATIAAISERLHDVHAYCGDWTRVLSNVSLSRGSSVGIFLDPPYSYKTGRQHGLYNHEMPDTAAVESWCSEHGRQRRIRIVLAGFDGEYRLRGWRKCGIKKKPHVARTDDVIRRNARECLWFSPACDRTDPHDS